MLEAYNGIAITRKYFYIYLPQVRKGIYRSFRYSIIILYRVAEKVAQLAEKFSEVL